MSSQARHQQKMLRPPCGHRILSACSPSGEACLYSGLSVSDISRHLNTQMLFSTCAIAVMSRSQKPLRLTVGGELE